MRWPQQGSGIGAGGRFNVLITLDNCGKNAKISIDYLKVLR